MNESSLEAHITVILSQRFYHKVDLLNDTNNIQEIPLRALVSEILLEYSVNPIKY